MQGYIQDHRKELESDVWSMPPLYHRTWQWLKYNVNHEDSTIPMRDGSHMTIRRGQRLTSIRDIAKSIGWYEGTKRKEPNPKTISTILDWMEKTGMISIERGQGNRQYTLVTLIKYEEYQAKKDQGNSKVTVREQHADINNNDNNDLSKKHIVDSSECDLMFEEWYAIYPKQGSVRKKAVETWRSLWKKKEIDMEQMKTGTLAYLAHQAHHQYKVCGAQVFLNQERWKSDWSISEGAYRGNRKAELPLVDGAGDDALINAYGRGTGKTNEQRAAYRHQ